MLGNFDYIRAETVEHGCALLARTPGAAVLAGGTDLLVNIRNKAISPPLLVDFKGIAALNAISHNADGTAIGAAVPLNAIAEDQRIRTAYQALFEAATAVATYQVRNRATLIGNLCNASPAADTAPPLFVLDAHVEISGPAGARTLPVRDLPVGVKKAALTPGEVITAVTIPPIAPGARTKFLKKQRIKGHDLAIVNMAGYYDPGTGELRIAIGSCAPTPILLPPLDSPVRVGDQIDEIVAALDRIAQEAISPIDDLRATAAYRRALIPVFLRRLVKTLLGRESDGT